MHQDSGYKASEKKSDFSQGEDLVVTRNKLTLKKPNKEQIKALLHLKPPRSFNKRKSFLRAIQCFALFLPRFPEKEKMITEKPSLGKAQERDEN